MEIHAAHVDKSYGGIAVLRDVTFSAGPGVTCVEGPSGSGKTTLLRLLLGLEKPDGGTISGADCLHWAAVFQEDRLLEHLDAAGNLRFALGADFRPREAAQLLAELGLPAAEGKPAGEYSGGMKRRLLLGPCWRRTTPWPWTSLFPAWTERAAPGRRRPSAAGRRANPFYW